MKDTSSSRNDGEQKTFFCTNADDYNLPRCSKQCEVCFRADVQEQIEAADFRSNMERECKP